MPDHTFIYPRAHDNCNLCSNCGTAGNRSGYHNAKCLHPGEKADKVLLPGRVAFLLTTIYVNSSDWREMKSPATLLVELGFKVHNKYTFNIALPK